MCFFLFFFYWWWWWGLSQNFFNTWYVYNSFHHIFHCFYNTVTNPFFLAADAEGQAPINQKAAEQVPPVIQQVPPAQSKLEQAPKPESEQEEEGEVMPQWYSEESNANPALYYQTGNQAYRQIDNRQAGDSSDCVSYNGGNSPREKINYNDGNTVEESTGTMADLLKSLRDDLKGMKVEEDREKIDLKGKAEKKLTVDPNWHYPAPKPLKKRISITSDTSDNDGHIMGNVHEMSMLQSLHREDEGYSAYNSIPYMLHEHGYQHVLEPLPEVVDNGHVVNNMDKASPIKLSNETTTSNIPRQDFEQVHATSQYSNGPKVPHYVPVSDTPVHNDIKHSMPSKQTLRASSKVHFQVQNQYDANNVPHYPFTDSHYQESIQILSPISNKSQPLKDVHSLPKLYSHSSNGPLEHIQNFASNANFHSFVKQNRLEGDLLVCSPSLSSTSEMDEDSSQPSINVHSNPEYISNTDTTYFNMAHIQKKREKSHWEAVAKNIAVAKYVKSLKPQSHTSHMLAPPLAIPQHDSVNSYNLIMSGAALNNSIQTPKYVEPYVANSPLVPSQRLLSPGELPGNPSKGNELIDTTQGKASVLLAC